MKNTKNKAEEYALQSGAKFILAARKSDEENTNCSPELRAVKRLAAILGAWVNEPRTDEAWRFYQNYDSPCTNRMLHCSSDREKTCIKLNYAGKGDFADEIKHEWRRIIECANTADDNISVLRLQYRQGGIDKVVFTERVKREADSPRCAAAGLQGRLELIAKENWQTPVKKDEGGQQKKLAETGGNATPATIINIDKIDKLGVLGNVQAEIVQTGDYASIHKQSVTAEKKRGILIRLLKIIVAVVGFLAALLGILNLLGWIEPIKAFIRNISWPK